MRKRSGGALHLAAIWAVWFGASATGAAGTLAADRPTDPPLDLSLKFKVGDVNRYRLAVQVDARLPAMGAQPSVSVYNVDVELMEQEKIVRLLPGGGGEIALSTLSGRGSSNGTPFIPTPEKKPALIGFDARGDLISVKDLPSANSGMPLVSNMFGSGALSMNGAYLPSRPVRVGDTWSKKVRVTGLTGNAQATVQATLVKIEEVGHYKTAKIHAVLSAPLHTLIDSTYQPTTEARSAISVLTGTFHMVYDTNLAIAEGKVVQAAGNGEVTVLIQPNESAPAAATRGKPNSSGKAKPPAAGAGKPTAPALPANRMVMRVHMGNNLVE